MASQERAPGRPRRALTRLAAALGLVLFVSAGAIHFQAAAVSERRCGLWLSRHGQSWYTSYAAQPRDDTSLTYRDLSGAVRRFGSDDCTFWTP